MSEAIFISGDGDMSLDFVGHMLHCPKCGKKVFVGVGLFGIDHTGSISATCAECVEIKPEDRERYPEQIKKLEDWLKQ
jgi:hypothetical protein